MKLLNILFLLILLSQLGLAQKQSISEKLSIALEDLEQADSKDTFSLIKLNGRLATIYNRLNANELALQHKIKDYELRSQVKSDAYLNISEYELTTQLAQYYFKNKKYQEAKYYYLKTITLAKNNRQFCRSLNNITLTYIQFQRLDSANFYLHKALNSINHKDALLHGIILNTACQIKLIEQDTIAAIEFLEHSYKNIKKFYKNEAPVGIINKLCYIYLQNEQLDSALALLEVLPKFNFYHSNKVLKFNSLQNKLVYLYQRGEFKKAKSLRDTLYLLQKNMLATQKKKYLKSANLHAKVTSSEISKKLEISQENQRISRYLYASLLGILSLVSLLLYNMYRKKIQLTQKENQLQKIQNELMQTELKNKQLEEEKLKQDLNYQQQDLTNLSLDLSRKQDVLSMFSEKLSTLLEQKSLFKDKDFRLLLLDIESLIATDKKLEHLQKNIDNINSKFFDELKERYPLLTENDLQLCAFYRLGISNKEIAQIKNIAPDSVKKSRNRLRKRLEIAPDVDLVQFLKAFQV